MNAAKTTDIIRVKTENKDTKSFFFNFLEDCEPGQFFMIWLPGSGEVPMSISYFKKGEAGITVRAVGETTEKMQNLKVGDYIGVRGPYGNGFSLKGKKILLAAGGCGASPLGFLAEQAKARKIKVTALVGARNKTELLFLDRFGKNSKLQCATDDGSFGTEGFVTDLLDETLKKEKFSCVYSCGPEIMLKKVLEICERRRVDMQASLERYMKCGLGVCGSCAISGFLVCKDGPVFSKKSLKEMSDFGKIYRDTAGTKTSLK